MTIIKPTGGRILIEPLRSAEKTASGLVIPEMAQTVTQEAYVIALGSPRITPSGAEVPFDVEVGDKVIYSMYGGTKVSYDGKEYLIMDPVDLIAIVGKA